MKHIFLAKLTFGRPQLSKLEVEKETEKTFVVCKEEAILGSKSYSRRLNKEEVGVFEDAVDAAKHIIVLQDFFIKKTREKLDAAVVDLAMLKELLVELQD